MHYSLTANHTWLVCKLNIILTARFIFSLTYIIIYLWVYIKNIKQINCIKHGIVAAFR